MKKYLFVSIILCLLISCSRHSSEWHKLLNAESCIQEYPDSAYSLIKSIDISACKGNKELAKYSLLNTMAIDKNYIDTTDFSVIQDALAYYEKKGGRNNKFLALYYAGRIKQNSKDMSAALDYFLKAEKYVKCASFAYATRLYSAMEVIYYQTYSNDKALKAALKALKFAELDTNEHDIASLKFDIAILYAIQNDTENARKTFEDVIESYHICDYADLYIKKCRLQIVLADCLIISDSDLVELADIVMDDPNLAPSDYLKCFDVYFRTGDYIKAKDCLINYSLFEEQEDYYYYDLYLLAKEEQRYEDALQYLGKYSFLSEKSLYNTFNLDLSAKEEQFHADLRQQKMKFVIVLCAFVLLFTVVVFCVILKRRRDRYNNLMNLYEHIKTTHIDSFGQGDWKQAMNTEDFRSLVGPLAELTVGMIQLHAQSSLTKLLKDKKNCEIFLEIIFALFENYNPYFYDYLKNHNLSKAQIGYCYFVLLDYNNKQLSDIMQIKNIYNYSSVIRHALNLGPDDTRLAAFLKTQFDNSLSLDEGGESGASGANL